MLWRLAESWCPEDQTVPTATELAEVRELTPAVTACMPFCYRFLHILAAHMNGCKAEHVTTRAVVDVAEQMFANADHQMLQHGYKWKLMSPGIIRGGNAIAKRVLYWSSHGHVDWPLSDLCWANPAIGRDGHMHKHYSCLEGTMSSRHVTQLEPSAMSMALL